MRLPTFGGVTFNGPILDFGSNTAFLYLGSNFTIAGNSQITGSGGVVVSSDSSNGRNSLNLTNTAFPNTFTGGLYLNGTPGCLFNSADTQLGAAGEVISFAAVRSGSTGRHRSPWRPAALTVHSK